MTKLEKVKDFIMGRRRAYTEVFDKKNVYTEQVLKDLAKFCRAHQTTFHQDPNMAKMLEGRREVWLRIQNHLNLTDQELFEFHNIKE